MTAFQLSGITTVALLVMLVSAVMTDVREHRIPNTLVMMVISLGLISQLIMSGVSGLMFWVGGAAMGFLIFLPFYIKGGMGAGDVKLMAAVGSVLGIQGAIVASALSLVAGLPLALGIAFHRHLQSRRSATLVAATGHLDSEKVDTGEKFFSRSTREQRIPYAAAIAIGSAGGLWWIGNLPKLAGAL